MPTYEYECNACGHEFERFESMTAKPDKSCPKCNKKKAERRISGGGGLLFKGSGFYCTDYRSSSYKSSAKSDSSASSSKSTDSSTSKSDSSSKSSTPSSSSSGSGSTSKASKAAS
jgi:putative FmdB family regulatory protein